MTGFFRISKLVREADMAALVDLLSETNDGHIEKLTRVGNANWLVLLASRFRDDADRIRSFKRASL
jgi:hypothetical protein